MVDSGSDVVTLRPEIVRRLNLVKKCTVRSQGVHVAKEKTLYEAILKIGSVELKIEVNSKHNTNDIRITNIGEWMQFKHNISYVRVHIFRQWITFN